MQNLDHNIGFWEKRQFFRVSVGIDIPDYISTGGKADAIKSMSNKMKAMGKK
jgi:hypothetical protein